MRHRLPRGIDVHRIASLLPSATEIVCALGFENQMVGRSHECDYPAPVARLPVLTEPKFNPEGSSAEVNQRVKTLIADEIADNLVDAEKRHSLQTSVIVT